MRLPSVVALADTGRSLREDSFRADAPAARSGLLGQLRLELLPQRHGVALQRCAHANPI